MCSKYSAATIAPSQERVVRLIVVTKKEPPVEQNISNNLITFVTLITLLTFLTFDIYILFFIFSKDLQRAAKIWYKVKKKLKKNHFYFDYYDKQNILS
jgi:hypothetical protein